MCKSKDAVIASYHWAVLHTPVDTRAMYYVSSLLPLFVSRTFRYGRGERQDCEKKDRKGDRVGVFQWLARLARLARMARMARTFRLLARWLTHWPHSFKLKRLRIFRDTLILVFVNENCCLCKCFTELYFFYWLLVVSLAILIACSWCLFSLFMNIACRST